MEKEKEMFMRRNNLSENFHGKIQIHPARRKLPKNLVFNSEKVSCVGTAIRVQILIRRLGLKPD